MGFIQPAEGLNRTKNKKNAASKLPVNSNCNPSPGISCGSGTCQAFLCATWHSSHYFKQYRSRKESCSPQQSSTPPNTSSHSPSETHAQSQTEHLNRQTQDEVNPRLQHASPSPHSPSSLTAMFYPLYLQSGQRIYLYIHIHIYIYLYIYIYIPITMPPISFISLDNPD